jgi:hypothetical protein
MREMNCTDIIDEYYDNIAKNYIKYASLTTDEIIMQLSKAHVVIPYKIEDVQNYDIVLWDIKNKCAGLSIYNNGDFYFSSKEGINVLPSFPNYIIKDVYPQYIIRLKK